MQDTITQCRGLISQYNPLSTQPGALIQADDCVIRRENTIENRRGYASYGSLGSAPTALLTYLKRVIAHNGTSLSYDNGSGAFANYAGTYNAPTDYKMHGAETKSNLYITTDQGIQVLTDVAGSQARKAGSPRSLDPSYALDSATSGFLGTLAQCAYRVVIQRTDANGNTVFGYPSTRLWVYNSAGTSKNVGLTLYLPAEVTTSDILQVYRTAQVSGSTSDIAGDEMALVFQVSPAVSDITNTYITFTDSVNDSLRGASLYTSPSQEGVAQANERPPLSRDVCLYKSAYLMYANTTTKQRLQISLVGTPALYNGGAYGKTIKIAGTTYTFGATENSATGTVQVNTPGVAASDIDFTARSLVKVINRYSANTSVYAYYLSDPTSLPGQIMIEERGIGAAAFSVFVIDTATAVDFFPPPPVTTATIQSTSTNSVQKNAIYFSKTQQPEHVPLANYVLVGPANTEIQRIVALRDSLIVIKEEGVYALRGDSPQTFSVVPLDLTVFCKAPESIKVLANQAFGLFNQGVCSISDTGVQVVSREIEATLTPLLGLSNLSNNTYAGAYESERTYLLSTVATLADASPSQIFCFNIFTRTWTRWTFGFTAACVEASTDKLFFAKATSAAVYRERKSFTTLDYADADLPITITAVSGNQVTFTISGPTPVSGWAIGQGISSIPIDTIVNNGSSFTATLIYSAPSTWAAGSGTIYPAINLQVVWDAWTAQQPALLKHTRQYEVLTDNLSGNNQTSGFIATFKTDQDAIQDQVSITTAAYRWGLSPWGGFPWGGRSDIYAYRTYIPKTKNYCRIMNPGVTHQRALEKISISGFSMTYDLIGERTGR